MIRTDNFGAHPASTAGHWKNASNNPNHSLPSSSRLAKNAYQQCLLYFSHPAAPDPYFVRTFSLFSMGADNILGVIFLFAHQIRLTTSLGAFRDLQKKSYSFSIGLAVSGYCLFGFDARHTNASSLEDGISCNSGSAGV